MSNDGGRQSRKRTTKQWVAASGLAAVLVGVIVVVIVVAVHHSHRHSTGQDGSGSNSSSTSASPIKTGPTSLSSGSTRSISNLSCTAPMAIPRGSTITEQEGTNGGPTYTNPEGQCGKGPTLPPLSQVSVACRLYSPQPSSVVPDGYWYLIASGSLKGYFAAANTFLNGDPIGGGNIHNTDVRIPICKIA